MIIGKQKKIQKSKKTSGQSLAELNKRGLLLLQKAIDDLEYREIEEKFLFKLFGEVKKREKTEN